MKKFYLSLLTFIIVGYSFSQSTFNVQDQNLGEVIFNKKESNKFVNPNTLKAGPFTLYVEPIGDIMTKKGYILDGGSSAQEKYYLAPIFCDSTVKSSFPPSSTKFIDDILLGSVLDPKSKNLLTSSNPIVTSNDPYSIDSIFIMGSYVKKTANQDTLYVWLVWGDPTNTAVFTQRPSNIWVAPISTWREAVIGAKINGAAGGPGNILTCGAPSSNFKLIKHVLTNTDSVSTAGYYKYIGIASAASIPAGNIVSCFYTYVPGSTYIAGDCSYSYAGAPVTQNINGFAGIVWSQSLPAVTTVNDYVNYQVDTTSWCMASSYTRKQRHSVYPVAYNNSLFGNLTVASIIIYKISGTSTVGVSEFEKKGFTVSQNIPNPFNGTSVIEYELSEKADVTLLIYDVTGKKIAEQSEGKQISGRQTLNFNSENLSAGIYYYSLKINNDITPSQKMVIIK